MNDKKLTKIKCVLLYSREFLFICEVKPDSGDHTSRLSRHFRNDGYVVHSEKPDF